MQLEEFDDEFDPLEIVRLELNVAGNCLRLARSAPSPLQLKLASLVVLHSHAIRLGGEETPPDLLLLRTIDIKVIFIYAIILCDALVTLPKLIILHSLFRDSLHFLLLLIDGLFGAIIGSMIGVPGGLIVVMPIGLGLLQVVVDVCQWRLVLAKFIGACRTVIAIVTFFDAHVHNFL